MTFRLAWLVLLVVALSACQHRPVRSPLAEWSPSSNFDVRKPRLIVLHATEMSSATAALNVLKTQNASGRVSAHYLIAESGHITQLVGDESRAWHAGAGRWQGINDLNSVSIGIELDNDGNEAFAPEQIRALVTLLADLCQRHGISKQAVIGHGDLAPTRKRDPSAKFPWQQLAEAGFGLWYPEILAEPPSGFDAHLALAAIGYDTRDLAAAVRAFHRHFRAMESDGEALDAIDAKILFQLSQNRINP